MTPYVNDQDFTLYQGDVLEVLAGLPAESVHCCVTSPPYWGLRDYGAEGQLGLEPTPEEYVANMVAVFREVRRVLRRDGTCWLNIGDSYNTLGQKGPNGHDKSTLTGGGPDYQRDVSRSSPVVRSLKTKDLVGIPWRLAFALQQPYYTGTIKDERDRIWLAAMVEAEGCMFLHKRKTGQSNGQGYVRKNDSYGAGLEVASTDRVIVERCMAIAGIGSICEQGPNENARRKQTIYRWNVRSNECRDIIRELYPHFIAKQHEARLLLGCPSSGDKAEAAWSGLKEIHQGGTPAVDFKPPETLFEPGWYVRSDIVWSKANPMPESVTDRPTKAHEYLFLLTRSPRYFYDADAIREPAEWASWGDQTNNKYEGTKSGAGWIKARSREELLTRGPGGNLKDAPKDGYINGGGWAAGPVPADRQRNKRSVWEIATEAYAAAHFATFPQALVEPCVLAGTSERGCCPVCGAPWGRETESERVWNGEVVTGAFATDAGKSASAGPRPNKHTTTLGWQPSCACHVGDAAFDHYNPVPCTVLDPFMGSGTTALVARRHGRRSIGIELNAEYAKLAAARLQQLSLLAEPA